MLRPTENLLLIDLFLEKNKVTVCSCLPVLTLQPFLIRPAFSFFVADFSAIGETKFV